MLEIVITVTPPRNWKHRLIDKYRARIEVLDCKPTEDGGCQNLVSIDCGPSVMDMALADLRGDPNVASCDLDLVDEGTAKGLISSRVCQGCCDTAGRETFLMDIELTDEGNIRQRLITTDKETVRGLINSLESRGHRVALEKLSTLEVQELMTSHQEDLLRVAYERGYFEDPKRCDLRDLAGSFGISVSTASEILRKCQRRLMEQYFEEGG